MYLLTNSGTTNFQKVYEWTSMSSDPQFLAYIVFAFSTFAAVSNTVSYYFRAEITYEA